jgi:hypothetical protein
MPSSRSRKSRPHASYACAATSLSDALRNLHDRDRAVAPAAQRLVAALDVDHRQAAMAEHHTRFFVNAFVVRPAVPNAGEHVGDRG